MQLPVYNQAGDTEAERSKTNTQPGESMRVDMLCIAPAIFTYWNSLMTASTGAGQNAAPANPVTNLRGGALGYFSAHT